MKIVIVFCFLFSVLFSSAFNAKAGLSEWDSSGWSTSYSDYPSFSGRREGSSVISIDLDPQNILNSSLRIAARENRYNDVNRFLAQGADINSPSDSGETAMMYASRNCTPKLVDFLIRQGANVNAADDEGRTSLMLAAQGSCKDVASLLLKTPGIRFDVRDHANKTALDYASENTLLEVGGPSQRVIQLISSARFKMHLARKQILKKQTIILAKQVAQR